ncbi:amidohydrolase [Murimonas intestini]|uniref:Aminobenzoyl-glutamate utilization protein B n=1 Tax=Murimonas intestini TaxID=1337051 RepID=A0AB73SZC4_9FIRM|nr:amidohydrolase [Murimonas intestini]MCR1842815.1 amidohydrolase [Murimonas intestini]MCR1867846.1 amidohydrolase [Murimonas intestini]MCR1885197.1 amidohydrolase [Murimonas intestini]
MNNEIRAWYEKYKAECIKLSDKIHGHPERSGEEYYACSVTAAFMEAQGFTVETYCIPPAEKPNCVIARWGSGSPVIGVIGEYDALPGLGQKAVPYYSPLPGPGHGCGHNLMAAGCASAAAAAKAAVKSRGLEGTIVYLACPAEEGGYGKVHMIDKGLFDGIDLCVAWHDEGPFRIAEFIMQALTGILYEFRGKTAHAACCPEEGRSALDAVQLMNIGAEFLREHVPQETRIHYCIPDGGVRPNIVPGYASAYYYVRSRERKSNEEVIKRLDQTAKGAAMMTDTSVSSVCMGGSWESLLNFTLNEILYEAALSVPKPRYTKDEWEFAEELFRNASGREASEDERAGLLSSEIQKPSGEAFYTPGSSDITDVSQIMPVTQFFGGGTVNGLSGHHWSTVAAAGTSIGHKGLLFAGEVMAEFCSRVMEKPEIVSRAKEEFREKKNKSVAYYPVLPENGKMKIYDNK